jgi:glycolate oxidase
VIDAKYTKVTSELVETLKGIAGSEGVSADEEEREKYSCDEMSIPKPHLAEVIVKPRDTATVARVLSLANEKRIPVTPRGSGTGLSGGCVPIFGGILLSLERMNQILEIDEENFVATVEPGVILADLYEAVEGCGLYYPLYPGESSASIGGNVATNAGGMRAVKYGVTRQLVLGLEAVLPTGEIISMGGKFVKSSTGYDLMQLLIGSEGTLGMITKIMLKLTTPPKRREVLFIPFNSLYDAIKAVPDILKHKILPVGIEFMERDIISIVEGYINRQIPFHDYEAFLMIILEGETEEEVYEAADGIREICMNNGAVDTFVPSSEAAKRKLLDAREKFYHALKHLGPMDIADVVVPRSQIPEFIKRVKEISRRHQMPIIAYGHAGDGNVHVHPLGKDMDRDEWERRLPRVFADIYQAGASLGGVISGEHGLGFEKKGYLTATMDEKLIILMKRIKRAFDPNNILNPGKIFDLE